MIAIDRALVDPNLFALGGASWSTWRTVLKAAFALPLTEAEHAIFTTVAGDRPLPSRRVRELWCTIGRRSGKSRIAAVIADFLACFEPHILSPGEIGYVLVLAASKAQASVVFAYVRGSLEASPVLASQIESMTAEEIRLQGNIVISVVPNSFRTTRGRTLLAVIFDEVSYWKDESTATPDIETYRAVLPALVASNGMLIAISTGYRKTGLLYNKHRDHFSVDDPNILAVQGDSRTFNPTLDQAIIASAVADDPEAAEAEWHGGFRSDIASFLGDGAIEAAIDHGRPLELPPRPNFRYAAFVDPSGGRHDAFTLCIGHMEGERLIADVVRGRAPPFDPQAVVHEYAALVKSYGIRELSGDNYSASWVETAFREAGITYKRSELAKSALYLEALPLFTRGAISLPHHAKLIRELKLLERRTSRVGRDIVDHGRNGSDDYANALGGVAAIAVKPRGTLRVATLANDYGGQGAGHDLLGGGPAAPRRVWSRQPGISAIDGTRRRARIKSKTV
jgi:hypothetical protein